MGFFARLGLAFGLFFKILFDAALARKAAQLGEGAPTPEPSAAPEKAPEKAPAPEPEPAGPGPDAGALQLLAALQREGRFVDFVQESIDGLEDADVGAAVRMVHAGCRKIVRDWFAPAAATVGDEGATMVLEHDYDRTTIRLTGNVTGDPPFHGVLAHHGWRATRASLPTLTGASDPMVIAPAEVEL